MTLKRAHEAALQARKACTKMANLWSRARVQQCREGSASSQRAYHMVLVVMSRLANCE